MSAILLRHLRIGVAVCGAWTGIAAAHADNAHDYPETGTVIAATVEHGYVYTIETGDMVYQMVCASAVFFHVSSHPCTIGGRPVSVKDAIHFRVDGDIARMAANGDSEEKLIILSTELKVLPPIPASTVAIGDCGAVLGAGVEIHPSSSSGNLQGPLNIPSPPAPSTAPPSAGSTTASATNPVIANAPVEAIPVTGGPPVLVVPSGPVSGGVVTGVTTSGKPVTAVPTGPVTGVPIEPASAAQASSAPAASPQPTSGTTSVGPGWIHFLRVQTDGRVYDLGCAKSCSLKDRAIHLGDVVAIRIEKGFAYLSWPTPGTDSERKFEILDVRGIDDPSPVPPHWVDPRGDGSPLRSRNQRGPDFFL